MKLFFRFCLFLVFSTNISCFTQVKTGFIVPNTIIAFGIGNEYIEFCDPTIKVELKQNDSTIAVQNSGSTYELRIDLKKEKIQLIPGDYVLVVSSEHNGIIDEQPLKIPISNTEKAIVVSFQHIICCDNKLGKQLLFDYGTDGIVFNMCDNINATVDLLKESEKSFTIIGVMRDSLDSSIVDKRMNIVEEILIKRGVAISRIKKEKRFYKTYVFSFHPGLIYPIDEQEACQLNKNCEVGLIIEFED